MDLYHAVPSCTILSFSSFTDPALEDVSSMAGLILSVFFYACSSPLTSVSASTCLSDGLFSSKDANPAIDVVDGTSPLALFVGLSLLSCFSIILFSDVGVLFRWPKMDVSFMHFDAAFCKSACRFLEPRSDDGIFIHEEFHLFSEKRVCQGNPVNKEAWIDLMEARCRIDNNI